MQLRHLFHTALMGESFCGEHDFNHSQLDERTPNNNGSAYGTGQWIFAMTRGSASACESPSAYTPYATLGQDGWLSALKREGSSLERCHTSNFDPSLAKVLTHALVENSLHAEDSPVNKQTLPRAKWFRSAAAAQLRIYKGYALPTQPSLDPGLQDLSRQFVDSIIDLEMSSLPGGSEPTWSRLRSTKLLHGAETVNADCSNDGLDKLPPLLLSESPDSKADENSDESLRVHPGDTIQTTSDSKSDSPFDESELDEMVYNDELFDASTKYVEQEVRSEAALDNFNDDGGFYQTSSTCRQEPIFGALDRGVTPSTSWRTSVLCRLFNSNPETMCDLEHFQRHGLRRVNSRAIAEACGVPHTPPKASNRSGDSAMLSRGFTSAKPLVPPLDLAGVHRDDDDQEDDDDFEEKVGFANAQHAFQLNQHGRKSAQLFCPVPRLKLPGVKTLSTSSMEGLAAPQQKLFSSSSEVKFSKALPPVISSTVKVRQACSKPQISESHDASLPTIPKSTSLQFLKCKSRTSNAIRAQRGQNRYPRLLHSVDGPVALVTHSHLHIHYHVSNQAHEREAKVLPVEVS